MDPFYAGILLGMYGFLGIVFGIAGIADDCNRYAEAAITWCGPARELGTSVFDILYADESGTNYTGRIESESIPCLPSSTLQTLRICYPLRDPGAFKNDEVVFTDPRVAPGLLISGVVCTATAVIGGCWLFFCSHTFSSGYVRHVQVQGYRRFGGRFLSYTARIGGSTKPRAF